MTASCICKLKLKELKDTHYNLNIFMLMLINEFLFCLCCFLFDKMLENLPISSKIFLMLKNS